MIRVAKGSYQIEGGGPIVIQGKNLGLTTGALGWVEFSASNGRLVQTMSSVNASGSPVAAIYIFADTCGCLKQPKNVCMKSISGQCETDCDCCSGD